MMSRSFFILFCLVSGSAFALPNTGCISDAERCSCFENGRLKPSNTCPAPLPAIELPDHMHKPPVSAPSVLTSFPVPPPKPPRIRLGTFWVDVP